MLEVVFVRGRLLRMDLALSITPASTAQTEDVKHQYYFLMSNFNGKGWFLYGGGN